MIYILFNDEDKVVAVYTDSLQAQQDLYFLKEETNLNYYIAEYSQTSKNRYEYIKE